MERPAPTTPAALSQKYTYYGAPCIDMQSPLTENAPPVKHHHNIVIVGAGTAGITVAARLASALKYPDILLIDPSDAHYYQPLWTLVGAGICEKEESYRPMQELIPDHVTWMQDAVATFHPEQNYVETRLGRLIHYDYLVVCPGIQLNWHAIPGLLDTLGENGVTSNYAYCFAPYTAKLLEEFKGGNALFTQPLGTIKCGGAPQKILYLAGDSILKRGLQAKTNLQFYSAASVIFGIEDFAKTLREVLKRYQVQTFFQHELVAIDGPRHEATFREVNLMGDGAPVEKTVPFDFIHVTPPQSAPDFIRHSPLANEMGWVEVDKYTLQHTRFPNIFGLGDATSTPNAKTGAAVRKQAPVLVHNLLQLRNEGAITQPKTYNGYGSCPLVTGYGKLVLAEFDYDNNPTPSVPFIDTTREQYSMYLLKRHVLPQLYWHGMLKGRA